MFCYHYTSWGNRWGVPGALTGAGEVENLKKHNFRAKSWIWLDFGGSGGIWKDFDGFWRIFISFGRFLTVRPLWIAPKRSETLRNIVRHLARSRGATCKPLECISGPLGLDFCIYARQIQIQYLSIRYSTVGGFRVIGGSKLIAWSWNFREM